MLYVLQTIYSLPYLTGAATVALLWPLYCRQKAHWQNVHHPLPDGGKHYAAHISRIWLAGLAAVFSLGYILLTAQTTQNQTIGLAKSVADCWRQSYQSTKAQIDLNAQNDGISRQQQAIQREYDRATSALVEDLVTPPSAIAALSPNDLVRVAWKTQRTADYQRQINDLGSHFDDLVNQRVDLDKQRAMHPLPESTCGK